MHTRERLPNLELKLRDRLSICSHQERLLLGRAMWFVRFHQTPELLPFVELENYLGDLLGLRVDLVMAEALKPNIGQRVLAEVELL